MKMAKERVIIIVSMMWQFETGHVDELLLADSVMGRNQK